MRRALVALAVALMVVAIIALDVLATRAGWPRPWITAGEVGAIFAAAAAFARGNGKVPPPS